MIQNIDLIEENIPVNTAIANASNDITMNAIHQAFKNNLIIPIIVGKEGYIQSAADKIGWDIKNIKIIDSQNEVESARICCQLAQNSEVSLIVKGHMHTDVLMSEYIKSEHSLRIKGERLSHIWYMTFEEDNRGPIIITDGALNIKPSFETKKSIISNVIKFVKKNNKFDPRIAILSATEEVLEQMESSVDAKKLTEWANITYPNHKIFGPLAFDNAISKEAASIKGISNQVAGNANIIIVPNIETGNSLVKIMVNFMNATAGGFIVGGKVPVVITSRSDDIKSRLSSISNAILSIKKLL